MQGSDSGEITRYLAQGLVAAGHDVRVLMVDQSTFGDEAFTVERIVCSAGDSAADLPFDIPCFTSAPVGGATFASLSNEQIAQYLDATRSRLDRLVDEFDPHIIHAQHVWLQGHLALETGVPYVLTATEAEWIEFQLDPRFRPYAEQAAENAGRVLAISPQIRDTVIGTFDLPPERVSLLGPYIDPASYGDWRSSRSDALRLLQLPADVGRIVAANGPLIPAQKLDTLLNAAAIYEFDPLEITTVIAGSGPQRGELLAQAGRLGLERVLLLENLDLERQRALSRAAELVVVGPYSPVALQAMACGTPVIGADDSFTDSVTDFVGTVVRADDHEQLAETILVALAQNWKATKGPAARDYALSRQSYSDWVEQITSIYRAVLDERFGVEPWRQR
jgi:glycosyltransferase involved in cell wall biosynthesis